MPEIILTGVGDDGLRAIKTLRAETGRSLFDARGIWDNVKNASLPFKIEVHEDSISPLREAGWEITEDESSDNIMLDYKVAVHHGEEVFYANRAEVFKDEQGVQWIKLVPKNGYTRGKETMIRTDNIMIARMS